jgi:hypothetical protein
MSPLTSVFACPLGGDAPFDVSVRINLENQALLRSGWPCPSNNNQLVTPQFSSCQNFLLCGAHRKSEDHVGLDLKQLTRVQVLQGHADLEKFNLLRKKSSVTRHFQTRS